jgi:hypothetical protein
MSLPSRNFVRIAARSLRRQTPALHITKRCLRTAAPLPTPQPPFRARFSTVSAMQRASLVSIGGSIQQYDPEIRDITRFIHNYKIDSDLAVCIQNTSSWSL